MTQEQLIIKDHLATIATELFNATDKRDWQHIHELMDHTVWFDTTSAGGGEAASVTAQTITDGWKQEAIA